MPDPTQPDAIHLDAIHLDVWSDIACPWCYIGKRKLEAGIEAFADDRDAPPVVVTYRSYLLMPDLPEDFDGTAVDLLVRTKGIPAAQVRQMQDRVAQIAAEVGLDYDFASQQPANTTKAHEVLHLARERGRQPEVKERLFAAHFEEGRHVGRDDELAELAAEAGLDADEVLAALRDRTYRTAVQRDIREARQLGIGGVPFTVIDGRYGVSGAQAPEAFAQALRRAWSEGREGSAA